MFDPFLMSVIAATFVLAGLVKGVIGLGLPTVSLALLTVAIDLPTAMALLIVPSLVTNVYQASVGGNARAILIRAWPFFLMATTTVWIGASALTRVNLDLLTALLGVLLIAYAGLNIGGIKLAIPATKEPWAGPVFGTANGILTGMTGSFVVPGVMFLQAIGLSKDMLVQAMGILFTVSTVALALALSSNDLMSAQLGTASAFAVLPALAGMAAGQAVRRRLSEAQFRRVFFPAILLLGVYIVASAMV